MPAVFMHFRFVMSAAIMRLRFVGMFHSFLYYNKCGAIKAKKNPTEYIASEKQKTP
jgi:hypothetical protein